MKLQSGDLVVYVPGDGDVSDSMGPSEEEIPYGTTGVFLRMGSSYEKFVRGCEPIDVLIGGRVIRLYMDEIKPVKS